MSKSPEKISHADWLKKAKELFGDDTQEWVFKCPMCKHEASVAEYQAAGADEGEVGFSCIGRHLEGRSAMYSEGPGPCDYAGGGLFRLNPVHVVMDDECTRETFEFGAPRE